MSRSCSEVRPWTVHNPAHVRLLLTGTNYNCTKQYSQICRRVDTTTRHLKLRSTLQHVHSNPFISACRHNNAVFHTPLALSRELACAREYNRATLIISRPEAAGPKETEPHQFQQYQNSASCTPRLALSLWFRSIILPRNSFMKSRTVLCFRNPRRCSSDFIERLMLC